MEILSTQGATQGAPAWIWVWESQAVGWGKRAVLGVDAVAIRFAHPDACPGGWQRRWVHEGRTWARTVEAPDFPGWTLGEVYRGQRDAELVNGRTYGKGGVPELAAVQPRDEVRALGRELSVCRDRLEDVMDRCSERVSDPECWARLQDVIASALDLAATSLARGGGL